MFKKIAVTVSLGALSLTGCSAASTQGTAGPDGAGSPASFSADPSTPPTAAVVTAPASASATTATATATATASNAPPAGPVVPHTTVAPAAPSVPPDPAVDGVQAAATLGWGTVLAGDEFSYAGAPDATK
ncbi:hypothetical protein [Arthrobacter sp. UYEF3]|uniref:hypothetical protein n=1 Tax=Arthrobacter sp. UYEF3 TaxID=1756365 RepID=UPI003396EBD7